MLPIVTCAKLLLGSLITSHVKDITPVTGSEKLSVQKSVFFGLWSPHVLFFQCHLERKMKYLATTHELVNPPTDDVLCYAMPYLVEDNWTGLYKKTTIRY